MEEDAIVPRIPIPILEEKNLYLVSGISIGMNLGYRYQYDKNPDIDMNFGYRYLVSV